MYRKRTHDFDSMRTPGSNASRHNFGTQVSHSLHIPPGNRKIRLKYTSKSAISELLQANGHVVGQ